MKLLISLSILFASIIFICLLPKQTTEEDVAIVCDTYALDLYCLTNEIRKESGKYSLEYSTELEKVSKLKSDDMCSRNYFEHDYKGESWTRYINTSQIEYLKAGENLAKGYETPELASQALKKSLTHYKNMVGDYTHVGIYTNVCNGLNYTTQTFAKLRG